MLPAPTRAFACALAATRFDQALMRNRFSRMNPFTESRRCYTFVFPRLDTVLEVEAVTEGVVVHASRDTFSPARKASFLRELAAEGFIGEDYANPWPGASPPVRWEVEPAGFMPDAAQRAETRRFMLRVFLSAGALWVLLMGFALLHASR
jgi:hypothetical protein